MKRFRVPVERKLYVTGFVEVEATDERAAIRDVASRIDNGKIQTTDAVWGDPEYEDHSFDATGDVEEV
jgi:hypothetical protein